MTREVYENVSDALPQILGSIMEHGEEVGSRQGERTMETLMQTFTLSKPWQREVLVPGRKASIAAQIAETMWVLAGRNDVEWLSHYLPRAGDFSDDGTTWTGGYGPRIRGWKGFQSVNIDQLAHVVDLLNNERGTRRAVINIYDPTIDSVGGKDVPCNNWLSFISRGGKLHMNVATRSNDVVWGWSGINQFEWSVLQEIIAVLTGNQIGTLTFNVTSLHVYEKHWEKANRISADYHSPYGDVKDSPRFDLGEYRDVARLDKIIGRWFELEEIIRNGRQMYFAVANFPEPMMQSWLRVIQWYWLGRKEFLEPLKGTRLYVAAQMSPTRGGLEKTPVIRTSSSLPRREVDQTGVYDVDGEGRRVPVPGTFPVADDGTITADVPPELRDMFGAPSGLSLVIGAPDSGTNGHQVGDEVTVIPLKANATKFEDRFNAFFGTRDKVAPLAWTTQFVEYVDNLHREKSKVYGDSWKKRGEQISILANIARKIDRLGVDGAGDSAADTVIDLLVYLAKYRLWINEQMDPLDTDVTQREENDAVREILNVEDRTCPKVVQRKSLEMRFVGVQEAFSHLEVTVEKQPFVGGSIPPLYSLKHRATIVDNMIRLAFPAARLLWGEENGHILKPEAAVEVVTNATRRWAGYEVGENID